MRQVILLSLLSSLCVLGAQEIPQGAAAPAEGNAPACEASSRNELYPSWGSLTPQVCEARVRTGMNIALKRLERLREIRPEAASYDSVFGVFEWMKQRGRCTCSQA